MKNKAKKIRKIVQEHKMDIALTTIYVLGVSLGVTYFKKELYKAMFEQVEQCIEALGLTEQLVEHMKTHDPY